MVPALPRMAQSEGVTGPLAKGHHGVAVGDVEPLAREAGTGIVSCAPAVICKVVPHLPLYARLPAWTIGRDGRLKTKRSGP